MQRDLDTPPPADDGWPLGGHLVTPRWGYTHHGIYVGGGRVVHYAGLSRTLLRGPVQEVSLADFGGGRPVQLRTHVDPRFAPAVIVERARSRLGEDRYHLASNNCEHFSLWCVSGESRSTQVEAWRDALVAAWRLLRRVAGVSPARTRAATARP